MDEERFKQLEALAEVVPDVMPQDVASWPQPDFKDTPYRNEIEAFMGKHFGTEFKKGPPTSLETLFGGGSVKPLGYFTPHGKKVVTNRDHQNYHLLAHEAGHAIDYALHPRPFVENLKYRFSGIPSLGILFQLAGKILGSPKVENLFTANMEVPRHNPDPTYGAAVYNEGRSMDQWKHLQHLADLWAQYLGGGESPRFRWDMPNSVDYSKFEQGADSVFAERGIPVEDLARLRAARRGKSEAEDEFEDQLRMLGLAN